VNTADPTQAPVAESPPAKKRWRRWLKRGALGVVGTTVLSAGFLVTTAWSSLGARPSGERLKRVQASPHYDAASEGFANALPTRQGSARQMISQYWNNDAPVEPESEIPVFESTQSVLSTPPADDLRVTWLGHSTLFVEIEGRRFLVDPVWGPRASPWSFLGPRRFHAPPIALEALPEFDAVVISHDHYDHLDAPTIRRLAATAPLFVVPLGIGAHLEAFDVPADKIVELDWWDTHVFDGVELVSTPSRHFSGRAIIDANATLWSGWAFIGSEHRAYYSGDTAMFPGFAEIGERLGPFDMTMMESGAYNPLWTDVHLGPEQAMQAHLDVRGRLFMPVHWGTFDLALHGWTEPVERILAAAETAGVTVAVPRPGESVEPSRVSEGSPARWWPQLRWATAAEQPIVSSGLAPRED
jgi:L-ascorbate metabolism protein UlaG (beta-lactamase superfamily)